MKYLCDLASLPNGQSRGFAHQGEAIFIVRRDNQVFAYRNQCPHLGVELEWQADRFLTADQKHIQCAMHGALFQIDTGECIHGPCQGDHLQTLPTVIKDQQVFVAVE